jgi:hypothetical protein
VVSLSSLLCRARSASTGSVRKGSNTFIGPICAEALLFVSFLDSNNAPVVASVDFFDGSPLMLLLVFDDFIADSFAGPFSLDEEVSMAGGRLSLCSFPPPNTDEAPPLDLDTNRFDSVCWGVESSCFPPPAIVPPPSS